MFEFFSRPCGLPDVSQARPASSVCVCVFVFLVGEAFRLGVGASLLTLESEA